jgi:hypothetical protein
MFTAKKFKRLIRARMSSTGESYSTARLHLVRATLRAAMWKPGPFQESHPDGGVRWSEGWTLYFLAGSSSWLTSHLTTDGRFVVDASNAARSRTLRASSAQEATFALQELRLPAEGVDDMTRSRQDVSERVEQAILGVPRALPRPTNRPTEAEVAHEPLVFKIRPFVRSIDRGAGVTVTLLWSSGRRTLRALRLGAGHRVTHPQ